MLKMISSRMISQEECESYKREIYEYVDSWRADEEKIFERLRIQAGETADKWETFRVMFGVME